MRWIWKQDSWQCNDWSRWNCWRAGWAGWAGRLRSVQVRWAWICNRVSLVIFLPRSESSSNHEEDFSCGRRRSPPGAVGSSCFHMVIQRWLQPPLLPTLPTFYINITFQYQPEGPAFKWLGCAVVSWVNQVHQVLQLRQLPQVQFNQLQQMHRVHLGHLGHQVLVVSYHLPQMHLVT